MSLDEILKDIGGVSYFQIMVLCALAFPKIVPCCNILLPIFVNYERSFNCSDEDNIYQNNSSDDSCQVLGNSTTTSCLFGNISFDTTIMESTIQSQYLLICDRQYLVAISSSVFFFGILVGSFFYGVMSDKFGRIKILSVISLKTVIVGIALPFSPYAWIFILGKLMMGIFCGGLLTVANVTFTEFMPAHQRLRLQMIYANFWCLGYCLFIMLGYFIRNHVYLQLTIQVLSIPTCLFVFILPESPRWLLSKKRLDDAFKATQRIAKCNRKCLTRECFDEKVASIAPILLEEIKIENMKEEEDAKCENEKILPKEESLGSLLKNKWFFIVTMVNWTNFLSVAMMDLTLIYFTNKLGGNIYLNLLFMALVEVPGAFNLMLIGKFLGRVTIILLGYSLAGVVSLLLAIFYKRKFYEVVCIAVAVIGKFLTGSILNLYWVYGFEAYPTAIRNSVVGSCVTFASIGPMLVPFIIQTEKFWTPTPFVIISTVIFICALSSSLLPETKDYQTLETVEQGIEFVQTRQIWRKWAVNKKNEDIKSDDNIEEKNNVEL